MATIRKEDPVLECAEKGEGRPSEHAPSTDVDLKDSMNKYSEEKTTKRRQKQLFCCVVLGAVIVAVLLGTLLTDTDCCSDDLPEQQGEKEYYESNSGAFAVRVPLFSSKMSRPYQSEDELVGDLKELAKFTLNNVINRNLGTPGYENAGYGFSGGRPEFATGGAPAPPGGVDMAAGASESGGHDNVGDDATDFSTNNQEDGVDEADLVKSDGTFVFSAYGEYLVIWDTDGNMIQTLRMPPMAINNTHTGGGGPPGTVDSPPNRDPPPPGEDPPGGDGGSDGGTSSGSTGGVSGSSGSAGGATGSARSFAEGASAPFYTDFVYPYIQALLLTESNRLGVIVTGYGYAHMSALGGTTPAFSDYLGTQIRIYNTSSLLLDEPELQLIGTQDIHGNYLDARLVGDSQAHIVTHTWLSTYETLVSPLERHQNSAFSGLGDSEYLDAARRLAEDELIPKFVEDVLRDLRTGTDTLPNLFRIGMWQTDVSGDSKVESLLFGDGFANNYVQLASLDMDIDTSEELAVTLTGSFTPASWGYVYGTVDWIIFAGQSYNWNPQVNGALETTYLLGMSLIDAASVPAAVGVLDGSILNQFSVDIYDGHLRVATTIRAPWNVPAEDEDSEESELESTTENLVIILEIPPPGGVEQLLEERGRLTPLGKPNEVFTAVRFFDNIAYAVTYERRDPFYVLDLDDPTDPQAVGELNITGFSSYLHSVSADNSLILAVGQETSEDGMNTIGLQITMFNSTDPTDPQIVWRHVVEESLSQWSSSEVLWNHKAFRYLDLGEDRPGRLIIPTTIYGEGSDFDGFLVFSVSTESIQTVFNISHNGMGAFYGDSCYYCNGWLPERSLVFRGDVMTLKRHTVFSTDMDSGDTVWNLTVAIENNDQQGYCCGWF